MREARQKMRPVPSQSHFAQLLKVSQGRLSNWERGSHDPPSEVIVDASKLTGLPVAYFYGEQSDPLAFKQTGVYNNRNLEDDSGPDPTVLQTAIAIADSRTISRTAIVGEGGKIWNAKGARKELVSIFAFVGPDRPLIKLADGALGEEFLPGTVIVFEPDDYPHTRAFLLLTRKDAPDLSTIRYIDPDGDPTLLRAIEPGIPPESLSDWRVEGYAWGEVRGQKTGAPELDIRPLGIGPKKRISR
jgi:transcriptional regulator with XRE-family HTH domain